MHRIIVSLFAFILLSTASSVFAFVLPTSNKNVGVYVGLFGNNPDFHTGCFEHSNHNALNAKQLVEYNYTASDCVNLNSNGSLTNLNTASAVQMDEKSNSEDMLQHLSHTAAVHFGLNFKLDS